MKLFCGWKNRCRIPVKWKPVLWKNGKKSFWGGLPVKTVDKGIGLVKSLFKKAEENGVDFWYASPAEAWENRWENYRVYVNSEERGNVLVKDKISRTYQAVQTDKKKLVTLGKQWKTQLSEAASNTGDGITMALEAGAVKARAVRLAACTYYWPQLTENRWLQQAGWYL